MVSGPTLGTEAKLNNVIVGAVMVLCTLGMMGVGMRSVGMNRRRR